MGRSFGSQIRERCCLPGWRQRSLSRTCLPRHTCGSQSASPSVPAQFLRYSPSCFRTIRYHSLTPRSHPNGHSLMNPTADSLSETSTVKQSSGSQWLFRRTTSTSGCLVCCKNQQSGCSRSCKGIQAARGQLIYMADADSAAKMIEFSKLDTCMKRIETDGYGVAIGSRAHLQDESQAQRKWYRTILMHGFHALVKVVGGVHGVQDTQCGYKLFTRASAREVFSNVHVRRWAFDVEVLRLVQKLEIPLQEVAIVWHDADGSKMTLKGMINMARDLFRIRYRYTLGHWQFPKSVMRK